MMYNSTDITKSQLPGIAVRGIVPLPNNEIRIEVGRKESLKALKAAEAYKNYVVLLIQKNPTQEDPNTEDLKPFGVLCHVQLNIKLPNNSYKVKLKGIVRVEVDQYLQTKPHFLVDFTTKPSYSTNYDEELAQVRLLVNEIVTGGDKLLENNQEVATAISQGVNADVLSDILAYSINFDYGTKEKYLDTVDTNVRLQYLLEDIRREKYIRSLEDNIEKELKKSINENQKEYYLREKMKVIQDELGDKAKKETEIDQLRKKILEAKMPKSMEEKALQELDRYNSIPGNAAESGIIKTYLDFVISLPWSKESTETTDIVKAKEELEKDHYGLEKVKERILEYLAVRIMTKKNPQAILCLVGPPGVGKTSLARSIANALNKKFVKQALGGVKDEAEIRGHRRTYLGALPGRILQGMKKAGTMNPVFLLDEIDKMSSDYKGDPASAMLEVLDAEQNRYFSDHYLEEPYDLSKVFFITTANYLGNIPEPLRDRLEIVELSSYTEFEKMEIAKRHLIEKQLQLHGLSRVDFDLTDEALWRIIREYTREAGVRELERHIGSLIRKGIKNILMGTIKKVIIEANDVEEYLGKPRYFHNKADVEDQIGVVTGLAYTQYGGDTLAVEVTYYKGDGRLVLTGKLGDVMKESAQAALSYVKSNATKFGIEIQMFKENDIHLHVPEGAIPKDGPSAGVTIATAIISALSGKTVNHNVGMTGEITLRGRVLAIGGVREKSIAAHRSGLNTIIIPRDNVKDIDDIPESVKSSLKIIPVSSLDEVLEHTFIIK